MDLFNQGPYKSKFCIKKMSWQSLLHGKMNLDIMPQSKDIRCKYLEKICLLNLAVLVKGLMAC